MSANRGYVCEQNKGDNLKQYGGMKAPAPKDLPENNKLKVFDGSKDVAGPMQHKAMNPSAPRLKGY